MIVAATIVVAMTKEEEATVEEVCFMILNASYVFK